jgi:Spx/MgsR family transcriptional regulator
MKKAFAWLEGKGIEYTFHDYKKLGAPADRLTVWIKQAGWEAIVNTRGTTFRQLPASRQQDLNAAKAATLLEEFPSAIKRPVLEHGKSLLVGFDADQYAKNLL